MRLGTTDVSVIQGMQGMEENVQVAQHTNFLPLQFSEIPFKLDYSVLEWNILYYTATWKLYCFRYK